MSDKISQMQKMFDDIYETTQSDKHFHELILDAIDSGDPVKMRGMCTDPIEVRDPMDLALRREYWRGHVEANAAMLLYLEVCITNLFGVRIIPKSVRDLRVVVDNTKQEPRASEAPASENSQYKEIN
jgi:hypothetical protein